MVETRLDETVSLCVKIVTKCVNPVASIMHVITNPSSYFGLIKETMRQSYATSKLNCKIYFLEKNGIATFSCFPAKSCMIKVCTFKLLIKEKMRQFYTTYIELQNLRFRKIME